MTTILNLVGAVSASPDTTLPVTAQAEADAAPFAQWLDQAAGRMQQDGGAGNDNAVAHACDDPCGLTQTSTLDTERRDAPPADTTPTTAVMPDAAMIAALLNQMQTPYVRVSAVAANPAQEPGATAPLPAAAAGISAGDLLPSAAGAAPLPATTDVTAAAVTGANTATQASAAAPLPIDATAQTAADAALLPASPSFPVPAAPAAPPQTTAAPQLNALDAAPAPTAPRGDAALTAAMPHAQAAEPSAPSTSASPTVASNDTARQALHRELRDALTQRLTPSPDGAARAAVESGEPTPDSLTRAALLNALPGYAAAKARTPSQETITDTTTLAGAAPVAAYSTPVHGETPQPAIHLAPRLDTPEWKPAFSGSVRALVQDGVNSASLQLNPAELGPIDVRIVMNDQRADISFMVKNSEANQAIQSALTDLREQLARGGIQLGQTSVGNQRQDARAFNDNPRRNGTSNTGSSAPVGAVGAAAPAPAAIRPRAAGQIDTFA